MSYATIKITGLTEHEVENLLDALGSRGWKYDEDVTTLYGDHWKVAGVEVYNPTNGIRVLEAITLMREPQAGLDWTARIAPPATREVEKVCEWCGVALNPLELEESHFCKTTVGDVVDSGIFGRPEDK